MSVIGRRGGGRGQSLVEFALILPVFLLILIGIFDFGRALYAYNAIANASRSAARIAIVNQDVDTVRSEAAREAVGVDPLSITVSFPDCSVLKLGCIAEVRVEHTFQPITPLLGSLVGTPQLTSTSQMPIERVYTSP